MISSTSFTSKAVFILIGALLLLPACASTGKPAPGYTGEGERLRVAVLPFENLSGGPVPLKTIRQSLIERLTAAGITILEDGLLDRFMEKHRMRYTGGMDTRTSGPFRDEIQVDAVLITSVELYNESIYPKIALISRLVSTGKIPKIMWMDIVGKAGDDSPGILELGLVESMEILEIRALDELTASLTRYLSARDGDMPAEIPAAEYVPAPFASYTDIPQMEQPTKFDPKFYYRSPLPTERKYIVAVVPFLNYSERRKAGDVLTLYFVRQLAKVSSVEVLEPGLVRQILLNRRVIMYGGVSLSDLDLISDYPEVDLVLSGKVLDYEDYSGVWGSPRVDFSVELLDRTAREIVWSSKSFNEGDDAVLLFDWGKLNTASFMTSVMVANTVDKMPFR
ncbi:MAG: hypothetical protein OEW04_09900 [Nitrospirota bacterium]|nr:hypothetical protein [Nitrospirota bacterium]